MAPERPPAPPGGHKSQGFGAWIKTHQNEAMLGGAGIVVAIALYVKSRSSSASSNSLSPSQTAAAMQTAGAVYPSTGSSSSALMGLESILAAQQQNQQNAATQAAAAANAGVPAKSMIQALAEMQAGGPSQFAAAGPTSQFMFANNAAQELGQPYFLPNGTVVQQQAPAS